MRISYKNGNMKYKLKTQKTFEKEAKRLGKRYPSLIEDIKHLGKEILDNPHLGIDLGGGLRKIRMAITIHAPRKNQTTIRGTTPKPFKA